jgi:hypothetical protein
MNRTWQSVLGRFLRQLQWWLIFETWGYVLCRLALALLPVGAVAIMADQRWFAGTYSLPIALSVLLPLAVIPAAYALLRRGTRLHQAFEMDERAGLKDRISSAWEFLGQDSLTHEQTLQVRDALRTAHDVDLGALVTLQNSRLPRWAFVAFGIFVASFFVPSVYRAPTADAAVDTIKMLQLAEVESLKNEVETLAKDEDLKDLVEKLKEVQERFEQGDLSERDVMIALARMDKELQEKMEAMGVEEMNAQLNQIVPHLMASTAAQQVAQSIKEDKLDEAAKELDKLDAKLQKDELTPEEKEQLALNMGAAAAKLGKGEKSSLGADFDQASQSVKSDDKEGIKSSFKSLKSKMGQCNSLRQMKKLSNCLGTCKGNLGNKESLLAKIGKGESTSKSEKPSNNAGMGSVKADGNGKGLEDSYREMLNVQGMAGNGPVESEVEMIEGQTSASAVEAKEMYNEYAAVAEQALDQEAIPLSHRFHVKRYFQAIRPEE